VGDKSAVPYVAPDPLNIPTDTHISHAVIANNPLFTPDIHLDNALDLDITDKDLHTPIDLQIPALATNASGGEISDDENTSDEEEEGHAAATVQVQHGCT
jgi:hypothetical protein